MDIWAACKDAADPQPLQGELLRMIESQEQIATNALVDDLDEQAQIEALLETSKPSPPPHTRGLHYLLASPFRYPPLRHGSRFGTQREPSLFYGSATLGTALAETAYYRLLFWSGMEQEPPGRRLVTGHTLFGAGYVLRQGLRLQQPPFSAFAEQLASPVNYSACQLLGEKMRTAGIDGFEYPSARDGEGGINFGLFHGRAFARPRPLWQESWMCETLPDGVSFYHKEQGTRRFARSKFLVDGELPAPAV